MHVLPPQFAFVEHAAHKAPAQYWLAQSAAAVQFPPLGMRQRPFVHVPWVHSADVAQGSPYLGSHANIVMLHTPESQSLLAVHSTHVPPEQRAVTHAKLSVHAPFCWRRHSPWAQLSPPMVWSQSGLVVQAPPLPALQMPTQYWYGPGHAAVLVPLATPWQIPKLFALLQASQLVHVELQQTPSTQKPVLQPAFVVHALP
jgi:hypothetical protein